jgi:hypothetical protein
VLPKSAIGSSVHMHHSATSERNILVTVSSYLLLLIIDKVCDTPGVQALAILIEVNALAQRIHFLLAG